MFISCIQYLFSTVIWSQDHTNMLERKKISKHSFFLGYNICMGLKYETASFFFWKSIIGKKSSFSFFSFEDRNMKLFLVVDKKSKFTGANMLHQWRVLISFALTVRQEMDHFAIFDIIQLLFLTWSAQNAMRVIAKVTTLWD